MTPIVLPKYISKKEITKLTTKQLIQHKKSLYAHREILEAFVKSYFQACININYELKDRELELQVELELAEMDRLNSEDPFYEALMWIN